MTYIQVSESAQSKVCLDCWSLAELYSQIQLVKKDPPFRLAEEGWGEFEMLLTFTPLGKGESIEIPHDLNFQKTRYEVTHELVRGLLKHKAYC
jgi:transcription initiation factor IIF auxiliary subunit